MTRIGLRFMPPTQLLLHMKLYRMVVNSVPTCPQERQEKGLASAWRAPLLEKELVAATSGPGSGEAQEGYAMALCHLPTYTPSRTRSTSPVYALIHPLSTYPPSIPQAIHPSIHHPSAYRPAHSPTDPAVHRTHPSTHHISICLSTTHLPRSLACQLLTHLFTHLSIHLSAHSHACPLTFLFTTRSLAWPPASPHTHPSAHTSTRSFEIAYPPTGPPGPS